MNAVVNPSPVTLVQSTPALPLYLAEKYEQKQSANGKHYLSPRESYKDYVAGTKQTPTAPATHGATARCAEYGYGLVYPDGQPGKTTEAQRVDEMSEEAAAFLMSLRAIDESEAKAFERFLIDRATRNATYGASVQFELENWAARDSNASQHPAYGDKESKLESFAQRAGIMLALIRRVLTGYIVDASEFDKAASRTVYENANWESNKLFSPSQANVQAQGEAAAARLTARRF